MTAATFSRVPATVPCATCGAQTSLQAHILIDAEADLDLLDAIEKDRLNIHTCSVCGARLLADLPVLLHFRRGPVPFVFSPGFSATDEQARRHAAMCESLARSVFSAQWNEQWLRGGLPGFPRDRFKKLLAAGRGETLRREVVRGCASGALLQLIATDSRADEKRLVETNAELLDPIVDEILDEWLTEASASGAAERQELLLLYRALLRRCREVGIDAAFEESGSVENPHRSAEVRELWTSLAQLLSNEDESESDVQTRIDLCSKLLEAIDEPNDGNLYGYVSGVLGRDLLLSAGDRAEAQRHLERALQEDSLFEKTPETCAGFALSLGETLTASDPIDFELLDRTVGYFEHVLSALKPGTEEGVVDVCRHELARLYGERLTQQATSPAGWLYEWPEDGVPVGPDVVRHASRFSADAPARSVRELLDFLNQDSPDRFLYRGQTQAHGFLLPSMFRPGTVHKTSFGGWVRVSNTLANASAKRREQTRARVRTRLLRSLGKGIGGVVAQQYGLSSEMVDVSEDPNVAAFFATRKYPLYAPYTGTDQNPLGVIYRMQRRDGPPDIATLEHTLHAIGLTWEPKYRVLWFSQRMAIPALVNEADLERLRALNEYFSEHGKALATLMTQHSRIHYAEVRKLCESGYGPFENQAVDLTTSRLARQRGGFCYPIIWHRCLVPASFRVSKAPWPREAFANPGLIAIEDIVAVRDLATSPDCEAFYFKHSAEVVPDYEREYLWPTAEEDQLLALVEALTKEVAGDYMDEVCADLYDRDLGLIDRGYAVS